MTELLYKAVGHYAHPFMEDTLSAGRTDELVGPEYAASTAPNYFNCRKTSIYGGSNEIQKNIIAKAVLRL